MSFLQLFIVLAMVVWLAARQFRDDPSDANRRWARVAQRRAPVRRAPDSDAGRLLDHVERQLDLLLAERQRLTGLARRGEQLKHKMQLSAAHRPRVAVLQRQLNLLAAKASRLDELIGRYHQHRDDLSILEEGERFSREVEAYEADASVRTAPVPVAETAAELDEEAERLLAVADAEDELTLMLQA